MNPIKCNFHLLYSRTSNLTNMPFFRCTCQLRHRHGYFFGREDPPGWGMVVRRDLIEKKEKIRYEKKIKAELTKFKWGISIMQVHFWGEAWERR